MQSISTLDLLVGLSEPGMRAAVARKLADRLGVDEVLVFVRDPELGVLIPAPGVPQTLNGGRSWRSWLRGCPDQGRLDGEVELPSGSVRNAVALCHPGCAVVLLGNAADQAELQLLQRVLPALAALLRAEQEASLARSEAAAARDVAERVRELAAALESTRAETAKLNAELRREHSRKDSFLAMLGHELRNPLAPLITTLELLSSHGTTPQALQRQLQVMSRQANHLSRLVEDLLDVSRVSRGQIELRRQCVSLTEVLHEALEEARPLLSRRGHQVVVRNCEDDLAVDGDRVRLVQIFGNLINNAAKYTDSGGRLTLVSQRQGAFAVVRLEDTGVGISREMLPLVFDLFTQAPDAPLRGEGGLGIGLTLVKTLVDLHGGEVMAESPGSGLGSTFIVRLPLRSDPAASPVPSEPTRETAPDTAGGPSIRTIVVDDNRDAADAMRILLRLMGHEARVAYEGTGALALAAEHEPDLMLVDIGLPGMDGYEIARRLRDIGRPGLRLVALTGYGTDEARQRSQDAGFDEHIVKPVSREVLEGVLARTLEDRSAPRRQQN